MNSLPRLLFVCAMLAICALLLQAACGSDSSAPGEGPTSGVSDPPITDSGESTSGSPGTPSSTTTGSGSSTGTGSSSSSSTGTSSSSTSGTTTTSDRNVCGGESTLLLDGEPAEPEDACGPCGDGEVYCVDEETLGCRDASALNACEGCEAPPGDLGAACDDCAAWACDGTDFACLPALLDPSCASALPTCEELECEAAERECEDDDPVFGARCGACREGFDEVEEVCLPPLPAPEEVEATTDVPAWVEVTWSEVEGAESWAIYREGERIAEIEPPEERSWQDIEAEPGEVVDAVEATVEESPEEAALVLSAPAALPGPVVAYAVRALAEGRSGELSEAVDGRRAAPAFVAFQAEEDGGWENVPSRWVLPAEAPTVEAGTITASVDDPAGVRLEASGFAALPGATVTRNLRALFSAGEEGAVASPTRSFSARRTAGTLELRWEVADASEGPFVDLGLRGEEALDEDAPADATPRWYRVCGVAPSAEIVCSAAQVGNRRPEPPVIAFVGEAGVGADAIEALIAVQEEGSSDPDALGFCALELDEAGEAAAAERCTQEDFSAGSVPQEIDGLAPGVRYRITPFADWRSQRIEGDAQEVRLLPGAVATLDTEQIADEVRLFWEAAEGAARYRILRGGDEVALVDAPATEWVDEEVDAGTRDVAAIAPEASTNRTDGTVLVTWNLPAAVAGESYVWRVVPLNADDAAGEPSPEAERTLQAPALVGWDLRIDGGDWQDVGAEMLQFLDTDPPPPTVEAGTLVRMEPERTDAVVIQVDGESATVGPVRSYALRARLSFGSDLVTGDVTGRPGIGPFSYRWQRSVGEVLPTGSEGWIDLDAEGDTLTDAEAPTSRELRWWRAFVEVGGATPQATDPISGFRAPVLPEAELVAWSSEAPRVIALVANVSELGSPAVSARVCAEVRDTGAAAGCSAPMTLTAAEQTFVHTSGEVAGTPLRYRLEYFDLEGAPVVLDEDFEARSVPDATVSLSVNETFRSFASIRLQWVAVANASGYVLRREGELVERVDAPQLFVTDTGAPRGSVDWSGVSVSATDDNQGGVGVSWSGFVAEEGPDTTWTLHAENVAGEGPGMEVVSRLRAPVVDRFLVEYGEDFGQTLDTEAPGGISTGAFLSDVPLGPVSFAEVVVTDDRTDGVQLDGAPVQLLPGPEVPLRVRFFDSVGGNSDLFPASGRAAAMTINSRSWHRAEDAEGGGAQVVSTQTAHFDEIPFLEPRWYQFTIRAPGGLREESSPWIPGLRVTSDPALESQPPTGVQLEDELTSTFRATFRTNVTQASAPAAIFLDYCISSVEAPDLLWEDEDCDVDVRSLLAVSSNLPGFNWTVTGIAPGTRLWYRSRARVRVGDNEPGGPWVDGGVVVLNTPVLPITDLEASQGTSDAHVALSWTLPEGALGVDILRGGTVIAEGVSGETFLDTDAPAGGVPVEIVPTVTDYLSFNAPTDHVRVTFTPPAAEPGETAEYEVVALGPGDFRAAPSAPATGFRAAAPIIGYEFSRTESSSDTPVWLPIPEGELTANMDGETVTSWEWRDTNAPLHEPSFSAGTTSLNEGVRIFWSTSIGSAERREAYYRVRAVNAAGAGRNFSGRIGSRSTSGESTVRFYRTTDGENSLLDTWVGTSTGGILLDGLANIDDELESYRVEYSALFAVPREETTSGKRLVHNASLTFEGRETPAGGGWAARIGVTLPGNPALAEIIVCQIEEGTGSSAPFNPGANCVTQPRPWQAGDTEFLLPGDPSFPSGTQVDFRVWRSLGPAQLAGGVVTVP